METSEFLPKDDQDLLLALRINEANESMQSFESIEDPLIQSLLNFKEQSRNEIDNLADIKGELWNEIASKTKKKPANITPIRSTFRYWAVAATVLIAAFVGIFWFTNLQQDPTLIAQSGNNIESIVLTDGSEISLRPNSALYEIEVSGQERTYLIKGEGFFDVAKNENRPFSVTAGEGKITVLGTRFNVSTWGTSTSVFLEEGSVRFSDKDANSVFLNPGQKVFLDKNGLSEPESANQQQFKDWLQNSLVLESTSVTQVINELEHHFKISIDISEFDNPSELISGSIALENEQQTLNDLGVILGGTFRKVNTDSFAFIPLN